MHKRLMVETRIKSRMTDRLIKHHIRYLIRRNRAHRKNAIKFAFYYCLATVTGWLLSFTGEK